MKTNKKLTKLCALFFVFAMVLTACGTTDADNIMPADENKANITESVDNNEDDSATEQEITMEALLSHAETPAEDFEYSIFEDYVLIRQYIGQDSIVVIPEEIEGLPVKDIGCLSVGNIKAVKFSDSVETIEDECLFEVRKEEEVQIVVLGANVKKIGDKAFGGFSNGKHLTEIVLNDSLETIGDMCFAYSEAKDVTIPASVTEIGDGCFRLDGSQTLHVTAGSYAETWCIESKEGGFRDLVYVAE